MHFFARKLVEADAKIKLSERESQYEPEVPGDMSQVETDTMLVELQLSRLEDKADNIRSALADEQDEQLRAIDEAKLEAVKTERDELESWLDGRT